MQPRSILIASACCAVLLSACAGSGGELAVTRILSSAEPIIDGEPLPVFSDHFQTGATVIYSYVFLENTKTMTGSFPVRLRWFYPNDFRPPMAQHVVMLEPGQEVAQFELHADSGIPVGPYQLIARSGPDQSTFTASGTTRFFVGMSPASAEQFVAEETEFRRQREEERARREAEEEERLTAESGSVMSGGLLDP